MLTRDQSTRVETEVNIQLGIFTLNNVAMEQLDERIYKMQEFKVILFYLSTFELKIKKEVFGDANTLGCATVKATTKRSWVRVMGTRIDLQLWQPDERPTKIPAAFSRKYTPDTVASGETWIAAALEPLRKKHNILTGDVFLPGQYYNKTDTYARLFGYELEKDITMDKNFEIAPEQKADICFECKTKFGLTNKRHHCK